MQKAWLLSVVFQRARPLICLEATLPGRVKTRNKSYTLFEPCKSYFTLFIRQIPLTPCSKLCQLMTADISS